MHTVTSRPVEAAGGGPSATGRLPWSAWPTVPAAWLYGGLVRLRNRYYDRVVSASQAVPVPVISVGNLTVGGTGKTPTVIELVRILQNLGHRPAILTRGYGAKAGSEADEVAELRMALPQVPVVVNPDRVAGATAAWQDHGADCVVLDDGFQHRGLRRDFDIVLIDALDPFGSGRLLPAGRLREPLESLRRAHWLVITRSNQVPPQRLSAISTELKRYAPSAPISQAPVVAQRLVGPGETDVDLRLLAGRRILAVCGLGNPSSFLMLLEELTGTPAPALVFSDHHAYRQRDLERICDAACRAEAEWVVTTRKDWVKLRSCWPVQQPRAHAAGTSPALYRLEARLVLHDPAGELAARLAGLFRQPS